MLSILSGCVVSYNYETLEDDISYIGQTTISYENIEVGSIALIGNNYIFILPIQDKETENNKIKEIINKSITKNKPLIMKGFAHTNTNQFQAFEMAYAYNDGVGNFCVTENISKKSYSLSEFYDLFENKNNKNCTIIYGEGYYYKINSDISNIKQIHKSKVSGKIKMRTDKKSGVNVGETVWRVPLTVFGLAVMSAANVYNDK